MRAALAWLIVYLATANREGRKHEGGQNRSRATALARLRLRAPVHKTQLQRNRESTRHQHELADRPHSPGLVHWSSHDLGAIPGLQ